MSFNDNDNVRIPLPLLPYLAGTHTELSKQSNYGSNDSGLVGAILLISLHITPHSHVTV